MVAYSLSDRLALAQSFADASAQLAQALLDSTTDPADAIRLLLPLTSFDSGDIPGVGGPLWSEAGAANRAFMSNLRCTACAALAKASALYQPLSYQDAQSLRQTVCAAIDAEATRAADDGRDATYQALRVLRAAVALDLAVRGANLAALVEIKTLVPMPSLTEAYRLYQDTTREPQLVASADPPHPLFMPLNFQALVS